MSKLESIKVSELNDKDLVLVTDQIEIEVISDLYSPKLKEYGCLFVKVLDGELREIWGCVTSVPWLVGNAYPLMIDGLLTDNA